MAISPEDLESRMKLKSVKDQLDSPHAGSFDIECPYCGAFNSPGKSFCCETMRTAVVTLLMGRRQGQIEQVSPKYVN